MIRDWFVRRREEKRRASKVATKRLKALLESELLPHLLEQGYSESAFLPAPQDGKLIWNRYNVCYETHLWRLSGKRVEELHILLSPDHLRGSTISVMFNVFEFEDLPSIPPQPGDLELVDHRGLLSSEHIQNTMQYDDFPGAGFLDRSLRKLSPEELLKRLRTVLDDPDAILREWLTTRQPVKIRLDGRKLIDAND